MVVTGTAAGVPFTALPPAGGAHRGVGDLDLVVVHELLPDGGDRGVLVTKKLSSAGLLTWCLTTQ